MTFWLNPCHPTNRITDTGCSYDGAGNLIGDCTYTYHSDVESPLAAVYHGGSAIPIAPLGALWSGPVRGKKLTLKAWKAKEVLCVPSK